MLHANTLRFLEQLKKHNNKEWMDTNRKMYLDAKADFEVFTESILQIMVTIDTDLVGLTAKNCTFRINRDVRFSANKAPYKTNMALYISKGGKKTTNAGYYCHIEPGGSFLAGGMWMPMAPELKKIRQEIDYNWKEFKVITAKKTFQNQFSDLERSEGSVLSRPPKGYDAENPAIEYLKLKSFIASNPLSDEVLKSKNLNNEVLTAFKTVQPFIHFLNKAIDTE